MCWSACMCLIHLAVVTGFWTDSCASEVLNSFGARERIPNRLVCQCVVCMLKDLSFIPWRQMCMSIPLVLLCILCCLACRSRFLSFGEAVWSFCELILKFLGGRDPTPKAQVPVGPAPWVPASRPLALLIRMHFWVRFAALFSARHAHFFANAGLWAVEKKTHH